MQHTYPLPQNLPPVVINDPTLPLVSVVTPSYNQGRYIRETITSVLEQDYPNLEYWVIDGGSTDDTVAILRTYEDDPRFHWLSKPDRGQADAVNKGWVRSRGAILGWLNSDDTYLPGAIRAQVAVLQAHPHIGLVYGDAIYTDSDGQLGQLYRTRAFDRCRFLSVSAMAQPSVFLRRELVEQYGLLDTQLSHSIDYELFVRLLWATDFYYNRRTIATYRVHESSKTFNNARLSISEAVQIARHACDQHPELRCFKPKATADWYWAGATTSLAAGDYRRLLAYSVVALRCHPLRSRGAMVALKLLDRLTGTPFSRWALATCRRLGI